MAGHFFPSFLERKHFPRVPTLSVFSQCSAVGRYSTSAICLARGLRPFHTGEQKQIERGTTMCLPLRSARRKEKPCSGLQKAGIAWCGVLFFRPTHRCRVASQSVARILHFQNLECDSLVHEKPHSGFRGMQPLQTACARRLKAVKLALTTTRGLSIQHCYPPPWAGWDLGGVPRSSQDGRNLGCLERAISKRLSRLSFEEEAKKVFRVELTGASMSSGEKRLKRDSFARPMERRRLDISIVMGWHCCLVRRLDRNRVTVRIRCRAILSTFSATLSSVVTEKMGTFNFAIWLDTTVVTALWA